jgi:hypothetical protein
MIIIFEVKHSERITFVNIIRILANRYLLKSYDLFRINFVYCLCFIVGCDMMERKMDIHSYTGQEDTVYQ